MVVFSPVIWVLMTRGPGWRARRKARFQRERERKEGKERSANEGSLNISDGSSASVEKTEEGEREKRVEDGISVTEGKKGEGSGS